MVAPASISSNVTGLAIAKELTPKVLPGTPIWRGQEPNSYAEFGSKITVVSRTPITDLRQNLKGGTTDIDSSGGFNSDVTQNNMQYLLEGFFCRAPFEKFKTQPINGTQVPITSVATTGLFNGASGLGTPLAGDLVKTSGFTNSANNGLSKVSSAIATQLDTDLVTVAEASPPSSAQIQTVGFEFASGDLVATIVSGTLVLTATVKNLTQLGLQIGEWIYIGGDGAGFQFVNGKGYARVLSVSATQIVCDKSTGLTSADTGAGKTIRLFFGTWYVNAKVSTDIIYPSYQLERQLGNDGTGVQSQYLLGCYTDKFAFKMPTANKVDADLGFVALNEEDRDGTTGIKSGTRVAIPNEELVNTSSNVFRIALNYVPTVASLTPTSEFAYLSEVNFTIDNGFKPAKAIGVIGAFDVTSGNFDVKGSLNAYFSTLSAISAIKNNTDITLDAIIAKHNNGFVIDFPLLTLGGGNLQVALNEKIKIPLDGAVVKCPQGYTASWTSFHYLPDIAMPA
jgi:hypothetical protein